MPARKHPTSKHGTAKAGAPGTMLVPEKLAPLVHYLRHEKVILDSDLPELYGVETGALNRAAKRNIDRFPADFMFRLTDDEVAGLRCQIGILNADPATLKSQTAISKSVRTTPLGSQAVTSKRGQHRKYLPYVFTEQGVAMLSSVLRSPRAVEVNIAIMRTFVQLRRLMDSNTLLDKSLFLSASQHFSVSAFFPKNSAFTPCPPPMPRQNHPVVPKPE